MTGSRLACFVHAMMRRMSEVTIVQVRDVPADAVDVLRARAERKGQSLAAYLREVIVEEASAPDIDEVMTQIAEDDPIEYTIDDLREFMAEGRR